jgi:hypothetical protein
MVDKKMKPTIYFFKNKMYKEQGKNSFPVDRMIQKDNRLLRAVKTTAKTTD